MHNSWKSQRRLMSTSSVIPVVLWGSRPPSHCISCIITTYDQKTVVTGSTDGQLGIWDLRFADDGDIKVWSCIPIRTVPAL